MKFFERYKFWTGISWLFVLLTIFVSLVLQSQTVRPRTEQAPVRFVLAVNAGASGSNQTQFTWTIQDSNGNPIAGVPFDIYVSDDPACIGLSATASSGTAGILTAAAGPGVGSGTITTAVQGIAATSGVGTLQYQPVGPSSQTTFSGQQNSGGTTIAMNKVMASNVGTVKWGIVDSAKTLWTPCAFYEPGRIRGVGTKLVVGNFGAWLMPLRLTEYFDSLAAKNDKGKDSDDFLSKVWKWLRGIFQSDAAFLERVLVWLVGSGMLATAPVPRIKKIGVMTFVTNAYGTDLFGPQGGLPLEDYDEIWGDFSGTLTITAGTTDGLPVTDNPDGIIKSVEVRVTGTTLADSFKEIPLRALNAFNIAADSAPGLARGNASAADFEARTTVPSGGIGVYPFRTFFRIPFANQGMTNPYKFFAPLNRYGQVNLRIKFGSVEDLVAGGDRTKVISASQITFYGVSYSFDADYDLQSDLFFNQHIAVKTVAVPNQAQIDQDYEIVRTASFLKAILVEQFTIDANGVETPTDQLIRSTDQVLIRLSDESSKAENMTWELWRFLNRSWYIRPLPFGSIMLDFSPRGDETLVRKMQMLNFTSIKIRANNGALANGNIRFSVNKFSVAA